MYSWSVGPKLLFLTYSTIFLSRSGVIIYLETLMRFDGASLGVGFSTTPVRLPSFTDKTPYFSTFSLGISTPRMAECLPSEALMSALAADSPSGFQMKSSPMKTSTGSLILNSSTASAIGTAVPYLEEGSCET